MRISRPVAALAMMAFAFSLVVAAGPPADAASATASGVLAQLPVKAENNKNPYKRDYFRHWIDADKNGCDTRREVLIAEAVIKPTVSGKCQISGGRWVSKFDNLTFTDPSKLDIDHMVPLKEAWVSGAHSWSARQREQFANDLGFAASLIAVSASQNRSKGDRDPAEWMPQHAAYHCTYATEWVLVKYRWGLAIDSAEKSALSSQLSGSCGARKVTLPTRAIGAATQPAKSQPRFSDVKSSSQFSKEIHWLADRGVTTGYSDGTFRPHAPITRDAMAAFMYRLAGKPAFTPPRTSPFKDVKPSSQFYKEITWLAGTGVTTGYADGTYRPYDPVTREAMAAFMYRLAGKPAFTPPRTSPFKDVKPSSKFYKEVTWLASTRITTGYGNGTYRPVQSIERNAMAAFMYRFTNGVGVKVTAK